MTEINRKGNEFPIMVPGKDFALPTGPAALDLVSALKTQTEYKFLPGKMQGIYNYRAYFKEKGFPWLSENLSQYEKDPSNWTYLLNPLVMAMSFLGRGKLREEHLTQEDIQILRGFIDMIICGLDDLDVFIIEAAIRNDQYEIFDIMVEKNKSIGGKMDISTITIFDKEIMLFDYIKKLGIIPDPDKIEKAEKLKAILKKHGYEID